jgi:hypothetical protein
MPSAHIRRRNIKNKSIFFFGKEKYWYSDFPKFNEDPIHFIEWFIAATTCSCNVMYRMRQEF